MKQNLCWWDRQTCQAWVYIHHNTWVQELIKFLTFMQTRFKSVLSSHLARWVRNSMFLLGSLHPWLFRSHWKFEEVGPQGEGHPSPIDGALSNSWSPWRQVTLLHLSQPWPWGSLPLDCPKKAPLKTIWVPSIRQRLHGKGERGVGDKV